MLINEIFVYNQYFVAMMNVINAAKLNPPESGHKHHIIPKCWFKMNNLPVDNSEDNLVLLSYEDHVKVHKLAILCASTTEMKSKMGFAVHWLLKGDFSGMHHTKETIEKIRNANKGKFHPGHIFTEETRKKMSERKKGSPGYWKGKNLYEDAKIKMSKAKKGRKLTDEHKKNMSKAHRGKTSPTKGKSWKSVNGKRVYTEV